MLKFPKIPAGAELPAPKMRLRDYARFSEQCLRSNPAITPANCMAKRAAEKAITKPFSLKASGGR